MSPSTHLFPIPEAEVTHEAASAWTPQPEDLSRPIRTVLGMRVPDRYRAAWVPGLDDADFDPDESLEIALDWLGGVPCRGERLIVMNTKSMKDNRPLLSRAAQRYEFISPRSRARRPFGGGNAVLSVWPTGETLELAQRLALDGALCVIAGTLFDVTSWIARTAATNLADPEADAVTPEQLDDALVSELKSILFFGGHNSFLGGGEKERAIRGLRSLVAAGHHPPPEAIEAFANASGDTDHKGAERLRGFYEGVLEGKQFRDYGGRVI